MKSRLVVMLSSFVLLSGCASIIEGNSQEVAVNTTPPGASCTMLRNGMSLGVIPSTPGALRVEKTKDAVSVQCAKPGYQTASYRAESGYPQYNWAYILVGGPIGWGVDSATGADNQYASPIQLELHKQ